MTKVYTCDISGIDESVYYEITNISGINRMKEIERLKQKADRIRTLTGSVMLKWVLNKISKSDYTIDHNKYGKPYIKELKDFHYNISHSGKYVILAQSDKEVGVDIEEVRKIDIDMAKKCFHPYEYRELLNREEKFRLKHFFEIWTKKESFIKAVGLGLTFSLEEFYFNEENRVIYSNEYGRYFGKNIVIGNSYAAALCRIEEIDNVEIVSCDITEIINELKR